MKWLLRALFLNGLVLYLTVMVYPGVTFDGKITTLVMAALALTILNRLVKPLIKLLLLPINLITLGLFGWLVNVLTLLLLTKFVPGVSVGAFFFTGFSYQGFVIPSIQVGWLFSYVLTSVVMALVSNIIEWLLRK